jgi:hypothetical protein
LSNDNAAAQGRDRRTGRPCGTESRFAASPSLSATSPHHDAVMQQVKIFKSVDTELGDTEKEINRWIRKSGAKVLSITGNIAGQPSAGTGGPVNSFSASDVLVVVLYEIDAPS